jgi:hypothetical protein
MVEQAEFRREEIRERSRTMSGEQLIAYGKAAVRQ